MAAARAQGPMAERVLVYRESPLWDTVDCWWQMRSDHLRDLYVAAYDCPADEQGYVLDPAGCIAQIRAECPDCVLIY